MTEFMYTQDVRQFDPKCTFPQQTAIASLPTYGLSKSLTNVPTTKIIFYELNIIQIPNVFTILRL